MEVEGRRLLTYYLIADQASETLEEFIEIVYTV